MEGELDFGPSCSHRHKRTHAEMDVDRLTSPPWNRPFRRSSASESRSPSHTNLSGPILPPLRNLPPHPIRASRFRDLPSLPTNRYPGDGLDFRRPAMSTADTSNQVIDLTLDDAGPSQSSEEGSVEGSARTGSFPPRPQRRFHRNRIDVLDIIDVDDENQQPAPAPDSPEIEFISSRPISPRRAERMQAERRAIDLDLVAADAGANIDLTDDDLEITGENIRRPIARRAGNPMGRALQEILGADADRYLGVGGGYLQRLLARGPHDVGHPPRPPRRRNGTAAQPRLHHRIQFGFHPPVHMDFEMVGFDLGLEDEDHQPLAPTYNAPEPAPEGFTRSPAEGDVLVCPHCDRELCTGVSDQQKQVWIVKACGHVYCGECTANRSQSARKKKGKEKADVTFREPFKTCVVEGCDKKVQMKTSMIQVFL